ncbi:heme-binding protein [Herbiconiux sp. UC225_62]|uniref:heme-binding protein n=1 Tax=Herbiconiux sp. UC225_62 TaxID=3350168 RepID=UPI0036D42EBB
MSSLPVFTVADLEAVPSPDLPSFGNDDAYELGTIAATIIRERGLNLAVDVVLNDDLVFRAKLGTTGPGNDAWLVGKAAVARYFGVPSLLVRRRHEAAGTSFDDIADPNVDHAVMKAHGGSIPIFVDGVPIGTITTSGEADVIDHQVAADAVAAFVGRRAS